MDVTRQTEVCRIKNLVCARVVENGFGVNSGFVSEGAKARDGVIEWRVNLHSLCNHIFNLKKSVCDQYIVFTNLTSLIKLRLYLLFT